MKSPFAFVKPTSLTQKNVQYIRINENLDTQKIVTYSMSSSLLFSNYTSIAMFLIMVRHKKGALVPGSWTIFFKKIKTKLGTEIILTDRLN